MHQKRLGTTASNATKILMQMHLILKVDHIFSAKCYNHAPCLQPSENCYSIHSFLKRVKELKVSRLSLFGPHSHTFGMSLDFVQS